MTPWELAAKSEHSQQRALFGWANCVAMYGWHVASQPSGYALADRSRYGFQITPVPELALLFAIHNQGHGDRIRGAQAKAEGVKAGVPDTMLPVPRFSYLGLFIELKKVKKGVRSDEQKEWGSQLQSQGYAFCFCNGWIEAANTISGYMGSDIRLS